MAGLSNEARRVLQEMIDFNESIFEHDKAAYDREYQRELRVLNDNYCEGLRRIRELHRITGTLKSILLTGDVLAYVEEEEKEHHEIIGQI